jgi:catechol 2,3-dioxygenase-like lactoylglutathione lyase family enzyme
MTLLAPLVLLLSLESSLALARRVEIADRKGMQEMIVSVKDLDKAAALYQQVAGWEIVAQEAALPALAEFWQVPRATRIEQVVLGNPSTTQGLLRIVRFRGMPQAQIRSSGRPFDTGGIFNLNMLVKDMDAAFEILRDHGFHGYADPNRYTLLGKSYAGAMLQGHDGVVINLLQRVGRPYDDLPPFRLMSHIINATQMVGDYSESLDFLTQKLGWEVRWAGSPHWPANGSNNMGLPNNLVADGTVTGRAASLRFGPDADGGGMEIFHFEGVKGLDFSSRAHPPNLGVLMYGIHVPDIEAYAADLSSRGVAFHVPMTTFRLAPYGTVKAIIVRAPSGAWLQFFQQVKAE